MELDFEGISSNTVDIGNGISLYYQEKGAGQPIVFIHGIWGSSRFFANQLSELGEKYHVVALDLRGHGRSSMTLYGQTVPTYAADLRCFLERLGLDDVVLVGWSMGSFVVWDYYQQFGSEYIKAFIDIDESPTDLKVDGFPIAMLCYEDIVDWFFQLQTRRNALLRDIVPMMFKNQPPADMFQWVYDEMTRAPEVIAAAAFLDQSTRDYREVIKGFPIPTLLCFGADEKCQPVEGGRWIRNAMLNARLEIFEDSGHCPFLEEPKKFNRVVSSFVDSLR